MTLDWQDSANCATTSPDIFFPTKGGDNGVAAKKICRSCEVRSECLEYSLESGESDGVYGGLTAHERAVMRRRAA